MIDALLRVVLGIGVSVVAAAVLLPLTVLIAEGFRRGVSRTGDHRIARALGAGRFSGELADKVETAIIGGLIGCVVFASLNPAIGPAMYDLQVQSGVVGTPHPSVDVHRVDGVSQQALADTFDVPPEDDYSLYVVELSNADKRTMQDFNFNARFPGCVEASKLGATNLGTAAVTNRTEKVQVGEFANRSANATCYGAVQIDKFTPDNTAVLTFLVDRTPEHGQEHLYDPPSDNRSVETISSYSWDYHGRTYHGPATLEQRRIAVENATAA